MVDRSATTPYPLRPRWRGVIFKAVLPHARRLTGTQKPWKCPDSALLWHGHPARGCGGVSPRQELTSRMPVPRRARCPRSNFQSMGGNDAARLGESEFHCYFEIMQWHFPYGNAIPGRCWTREAWMD